MVTKVQRTDDKGEVEVLDDKSLAEQAIAEYFTQIYKRPDHMKIKPSDYDFNLDEDMKEEEQLLNEALFSIDEVDSATKDSNFNKGLGPDCFDGNLLRDNKTLRRKVVFEIADALNSQNIPEYLRSGRLVPL